LNINLSSNEATIYAAKISNPICKKHFNYLLSCVRTEKKERILRQKSKQNADSMLIGEILVKAAIKKSFGIETTKLEFTVSENGKPYCSSHPDIYFNISHSGEYVVCAVSKVPVGVDIEKPRKYNPRLAERVCSQKEMEQIETCSDKSVEFIKLWTRKEAVLKMLGTGISNADIKNCLKNQNTETFFHSDYCISIALEK